MVTLDYRNGAVVIPGLNRANLWFKSDGDPINMKLSNRRWCPALSRSLCVLPTCCGSVGIAPTLSLALARRPALLGSLPAGQPA